MHPPISRHRCGQNEHIIQLVISPQSAIGGDYRAAESGHQAPVEIDPQRAPIPITRRVYQGSPVENRHFIRGMPSNDHGRTSYYCCASSHRSLACNDGHHL